MFSISTVPSLHNDFIRLHQLVSFSDLTAPLLDQLLDVVGINRNFYVQNMETDWVGHVHHTPKAIEVTTGLGMTA